MALAAHRANLVERVVLARQAEQNRAICDEAVGKEIEQEAPFLESVRRIRLRTAACRISQVDDIVSTARLPNLA